MNIQPTNNNFDEAARDSFKKNPSTAFSWFLSSSFIYYCRYESLLSDEVFDGISKYLLDNYDKLEHPHKHLVSKEMLEAGSAYNLQESDYPMMVKVSATELLNKLQTKGSGQKCT